MDSFSKATGAFNTPRMYIYQLLNYETPKFQHISYMMGDCRRAAAAQQQNAINTPFVESDDAIPIPPQTRIFLLIEIFNYSYLTRIKTNKVHSSQHK